MDLIIKNGTIVTASEIFNADVAASGGKIAQIGESLDCDGAEVIDAAGKYVLPGAIDAHTHLAMPFGGTISSDDYFAGTRAAACGGTTTVFDFVLQDFGETMMDAVRRRDALCKGNAVVDYAFTRSYKGCVEWTHRFDRRSRQVRRTVVQGVHGIRFRSDRRRLLSGAEES